MKVRSNYEKVKNEYHLHRS